MWVNVKRAEVANRTFVGGQQMYVEYMIPSRVRHPFPIVLVHGGGGQGLDWMGTPDGRPGWFQHLAAEGYKVYVVDRPGHGRAPQHPDLHGGIPARPGTMEGLQGQFIFGDFVQGRIWALSLEKPYAARELGQWSYLISTFGRDAAGEVYVGDFGGGGIHALR